MKKVIKIILLILWMTFIFYMSSLNSNSSTCQSNYIVYAISKIIHFKNLNILSLIVRKSAHIFEYFILYILLCSCMREYKIKNYLIFGILFSIMYSFTDEIHQIFIVGRSGQPQDILIDLIGTLLAFFINFMYLKIVKKVNFKYN